MSSPKFKLTPLGKLFSNLKADLKAVTDESRVNVENSVNGILAKDVFAKYDNPPFDNSAIDGFALNEDFKANSRDFHLLDGLVKPGLESKLILKKNEGVKILTGAPVPVGATRIIFKENTKEDGEKVYFVQDDYRENNIRKRGEDFKKGDRLFEKGHRIRISDLAILIGLSLIHI